MVRQAHHERFCSDTPFMPSLRFCSDTPFALSLSKGVWQVYIVRCADGTLYTGITRDVARRVAEHNGTNKGGARYTQGRRPVLLSYAEATPSRSSALKREAAIKRLSKVDKENLVVTGSGGF